jgi:hypothetical protein
MREEYPLSLWERAGVRVPNQQLITENEILKTKY